MQELSDEELLQKLQDLEQKISSLNAKQMAIKILQFLEAYSGNTIRKPGEFGGTPERTIPSQAL